MGKNMPRQIVIFGAFGIAVSAFLFFNSLAQQRPTVVPTPDKVDYNWDVKPILSDNCFRCHGPDAKARQAGLRLDMPEVAYGVIARGKPEESLLVDRISSKDPGYRMPPPETHKQLSDSQIAILKKWIAQGAEYKPHWAFIPPSRTAPPQTKFQ